MIMAWVKMVVNSPRARGAGFRLACDDSSEWLYGCGFQNGSISAGFRMAFDDNGVGEDGSKWLEGCGFQNGV